MKFSFSKFFEDLFGFYLPEREDSIDRPTVSEALFDESEYSLDQSLWEDKENFISLKIDSIKEKNDTRNFYLSTHDQYCFALYIAIAAFLGGIFTAGENTSSDFPVLMNCLTLCFFLGVLASLFRLRILREYAEISKDYETRGVIYYLAKDEKKAHENFEKARNTSQEMGTGVVRFANFLSFIFEFSLVIGIFIMAFLSFQLINQNQTTSSAELKINVLKNSI